MQSCCSRLQRRYLWLSNHACRDFVFEQQIIEMIRTVLQEIRSTVLLGNDFSARAYN